MAHGGKEVEPLLASFSAARCVDDHESEIDEKATEIGFMCSFITPTPSYWYNRAFLGRRWCVQSRLGTLASAVFYQLLPRNCPFQTAGNNGSLVESEPHPIDGGHIVLVKSGRAESGSPSITCFSEEDSSGSCRISTILTAMLCLQSAQSVPLFDACIRATLYCTSYTINHHHRPSV